MTRLEYLREVKKLLPPAPVCAEIGVYRGDFSKMILDELEPENLLLIDTFTHNCEIYQDGCLVSYSTEEDYHYVRNLFDQNRVRIFRGYSIDACRFLKKSQFDFVYIDADHRYESVKQDLEMWLPLLKSGGVIGGHDYGNEVFTGVKRSVDEFREERNLKIILLSDEGDFALK